MANHLLADRRRIMKRMMLTGGLAGFTLATLGGLTAAEIDFALLLLRACVGALVGGLIMRWWAGVAGRCLVQARLERQSSAAATQLSQPSAPLTRKP
jgi:hypothetical protein